MKSPQTIEFIVLMTDSSIYSIVKDKRLTGCLARRNRGREEKTGKGGRVEKTGEGGREENAGEGGKEGRRWESGRQFVQYEGNAGQGVLKLGAEKAYIQITHWLAVLSPSMATICTHT